VQLKIAETLETQGRLKEAVQEYLKVTYLYSEDATATVKAYLRVARIFEAQEDFQEALNIYKKVIAMNVPEAKYAQERIDWIKSNVKIGK
jgi:tetratricopeptide (TPR) repeat protein